MGFLQLVRPVIEDPIFWKSWHRAWMDAHKVLKFVRC